LDNLNKLTDEPVPKETFLRATLDAMQNGLVVIVTKQHDGLPLAGAVILNTTNPYHPPSLLVYAAYSEGDASVMKFALSWLESWARDHGFKELQAWSPRLTQSAFYLFEKKWGFKRRSVYYTKAV
jgi:hypothetical protein